MRPVQYLAVSSFMIILCCSCSKTHVTVPDQPIAQRLDEQPVEFEQVPVEPKQSQQPKQEKPALLPKQDVVVTRTTQQSFDEALEYCQTAQRFWEAGDLDNAMDALDHAYSLILETQADDDSNLSQQKEDLRIMISRRILEIYASRHTAAAGKYQAIPRVNNRHVQHEIKRFQGPERRFFLSAYKRSGRYRTMIVKSLRKAGLPVDLAWLPLIESGFRLRALSPARALGLWQFIPSTGYRFGLQRDDWVDERMDAAKATRAAIAYLQELHGIFGDWCSVLAAYNCGESRVLRVIRSQNINYLDNFWDLFEKLPSETARYVPRFLAVLTILDNPKKYGFELPTPVAPPQTEVIQVDRSMKLTQIAKQLKFKEADLLQLNAELRKGITPPASYELRLPKGKTSLFLAQLAQVPTYKPPRRRMACHRVREGETLSHIALKYKTSVAKLTKLNKIRATDTIRLGQTIRVPVWIKTSQLRNTAKKTHRSRKSKPTGQASAYLKHKVQAGDSLWLLAREYKTTVKKIMRANQLKRADLSIGQMLNIPKKTKDYQAKAFGSYTVQPGDSPYEIARKHNMELERFLRLNRLAPRSRIYPGQQMRVEEN